ncbi:MAG: DnaJ domain-containing protein [Actinomycetota bacterium]
MSNRDWLTKDFYSALGVKLNASELEIKKAYRVMARKHHPDLNPGDTRSERRFKEIAEAYDVLSDRSQRSRYDQVRTVSKGFARRQSGFARHTGFSPVHHAPTYIPLRPGNDLHRDVVVSFRDSRRGILVDVEAVERGMPTRMVIAFIPPGTPDGERICLKGRGGFGTGGGRSGDLYLTVKVLPAQFFGRRKDVPDLPRSREHGQTPFKLKHFPGAVRTAAYVLLHPDDVELNEALRRKGEEGMASYPKEIIRQRRALRH